MQLYVGTYAKYNQGSIAGEWVDLTDFSDKDDFLEYCKELHKDEHDPEIMFQDADGVPSAFFGECWVSEVLWEIDSDDIELYGEWCEHYGYDVKDSYETFKEQYVGYYDSEKAFAYEWADYDFPGFDENPMSLYFNWDQYTHDLFINSFNYLNGHVFHNA